ncbi:sam-dependent methyltransferase [Ophiocordyceps camponoti-floridani]|uniref:Sam-dependent methyltransferase n=1 Tax=Ophiocordyceps camponoti-floridani TaxID=2030778 RepID=A0A8H4QD25_9HYPO|nr:sam-dependent methyltransferase [Ophiocordyceps camponoti-floridani]
MASQQPPRPNSSAGAALYTPWFLKVYDFVLLRLVNPLIWNFPAERELIPLLKSVLVGSRHLDIGVGTGFYPAQALASTDGSACEQMTLVDLNVNALDLAARTIRTASKGKVSVTTIQADILAPPLPSGVGKDYDSISLFYLIHCLPGPSDVKVRTVADAVAPLLAVDGTLVGATVLGRGKRLVGIHMIAS